MSTPATTHQTDLPRGKSESDGRQGPREAPQTGKETVSDVYAPVVREGEQELRRSTRDLFLSGAIAGLDIGFGPIGMAVLAGRLHNELGMPLASAIMVGSLLYPLGFVFVIMGKSELFTENTLSPVAAVIAGSGTIFQLVRSWALIFVANIVGVIAFSLLLTRVTPLFAPYKAVYIEMGSQLVKQPFLPAFLEAVLAGWLVALIAWLLQTTRGSVVHFLEIYLIAYLLVAMSLIHSVVGSTEVLLAMFAGADITWVDWLWKFLLPAFLGNAAGGAVFVAGFKGFQASSASQGQR